MGGEGGPFGALGAVAGLVGAAVLLLAPGLAIASFLSRRGQALHGALATTVVVGGSAGAGFTAFFAWYASPAVGRTWSLLVIAGSALVLAGRAAEATRLFRPLAAPLALMLVVVITATGFAFDRGGLDAGATTVTERYWVGDDNLLPEILADKLYEGESLEPRLFSGWRSSDRPPLQAGWFLLVAPLAGDRVVGYQLASTLLQGLWVLGLWALLAALQVEHRLAALAITVVSVSGFAFVNTVFVWPKLLAGAFALLALAVLIERPPPDRVAAAAIAGATAFGLLSHAGAMYATFGLVPLLWRHRREVMTARWLGTGVATGGAVMVPWFAYQRFADPPGDALLKWHLAGVIDVEERFSFSGALRHTYGNLSPVDVLANKADNLRLQVLGPDGWDGWFFTPGWSDGFIEHLRVAQLVTLLPALGLLAVGLVVRGPLHRSRPIGYVVASILGWAVVQFGDVGPAGAFLHHGPYATFLLVFAIAVTGLATRLPRTALRLLLAAHLAVFIGVWSVGLGRQSASAPPHDNPGVAGWSLATGVIGLGLLAVLMWWLADPQQRRPRGITQGALGA